MIKILAFSLSFVLASFYLHADTTDAKWKNIIEINEMINIEEIKKPLRENGSRLIYQILDGLNWKQLTFKDIDSNIDYITSYLIANKIENKKSRRKI